jgi:hypothetical protein
MHLSYYKTQRDVTDVSTFQSVQSIRLSQSLTWLYMDYALSSNGKNLFPFFIPNLTTFRVHNSAASKLFLVIIILKVTVEIVNRDFV